MKTITVWMTYETTVEVEVEVEDDVEITSSLNSIPTDVLQALDDSIVEHSPTDWGERS